MLHTIRSLQDLQAMAGQPGGHYALGCAIDASATAGWNGGAGFVPVGTPASPFTGSFDGRGHAIHGLFIHRPGEDHVGLFGCARNATLRHLAVVAARIEGGGNVGLLVGSSEAVQGGTACIFQACATGQVRGSADNVGGLVGHHQAHAGTASIAQSHASGTVTSMGSNVGGLVGHNEAWRGTAHIANAYATGQVTGRDYAGGLVGYNDALEGRALISCAYVTGVVAATGAIVGGLVGMNSTGQVEHSFYALTDADGQPINRGPSADGQGRALDALKQRSTFTGWSIDDEGGSSAIWRIHEGKSTPRLRNLLLAAPGCCK